MSKAGTSLALAVLLVLAVGCDQITKRIAGAMLENGPSQVYAGGVVRLQYAENPGGFLSFGADLPEAARRNLFTLGTGALLVALAVFALRLRGAGLFGAVLAVSGGLSNLCDRVLRGSVIDFIQLEAGVLHTGIFNLADVLIMAGIAILAASVWKSQAEPPAPEA